ncbi:MULTISPECIES: ABC transporter ATP-binding protein [unclassified Microbacterium]|uniref:ABC transporter ATP-binding protein n=1 Tax=unclassified Microbacterium TaxID=2609290 RepID=UPI00038FBD2F|nr:MULTISPECIES: ABC transporter ATP-binding protein [unclassified Microbacterium]GAD34610.1 nitrate/sulfonate/bicarbonate ABC transporter ATP-binding protein [Microbacterium sp. TS-1]SDQ54151.1 NitT/TauT family transport system ATP-binding protein [Microbacterium sp. cf332]
MSLIEISDLSKTYQTRTGDVTALSHVDLGIAEGEFVSVLGPSGCGKTTLLRILAGLEGHTAGTATIADVPIGAPRGEAGMVFQKATLLPWLNILDNVLLPLSLRRRVTGADRAHARTLLTMVGLEDFTTKHPHELSGGMQQRAAICRALVHDPAVLLMDEPFGALDAMTRDALNVEVNRIWRETGTTAVLITHSISEAVFLAERVVVMTPRPGRIAEIIDIPFGKTRTPELLGDPEFAALTAHIRRHFEVNA